ncbi:diadenosine tetraphosphate hydrolase [Thermoproteus sp. CP80]|jgi:hypothetical protein|uniref:HIT family protein n=1 Tax=Thermoproteus sp. CP80 TaxID=1650659 RepID=UPI0007493696|nr:diadenosine tetraphosphate hydrolase [Thermoproteus sp. CP80]KUO85655.1 MAG: diadenosine tetraphosphate hydrolase [Thermoproteus sp. CIS_19]PLC64886.1 diadenosine tetraphosphate hydrolase [Thermoproteus sp. CP80]
MIIKSDDLVTVKPAEVPLNSGHVVMYLRKQIVEMSDGELVGLARDVKELIAKMKRAYRPEAYNVVLWDDKVEIVPRWCGDVSFNAFYGLKTTPQTPSMIFESYR